MDKWQEGFDEGRKQERNHILSSLHYLAEQLHKQDDAMGHHWVMEIIRKIRTRSI